MELHRTSESLIGPNPFDRLVLPQPLRIYSEDAFQKLGDGSGPLLGTQFFRDTEFVLDFEHSLLWVKRVSD